MQKTPLTRRSLGPRSAGFKPAEPKPAAGPKKKSCRVCRTAFTGSPLQVVCGVPCAIEYGQAITAKQKAKAKGAERAADRKKREELKTRSEWMKEAQAAFNAYVRERDRDLPCICCGRTNTRDYLTGSAWDAGHYRSTGSAPHLRFNEDNVHRQLVHCNRHGAGRAVDYRIGLIARIGLARVEALEADNVPRKYTIEDLKRIRDEYRARLKKLKEEA
ncbi:NinG protein [Pseudoduganella flava]|uniref:NinG protein n=1 Tax=Pseudoduganella flava TaxID=871742 RepID=A0A562PAN1_9BURK|nr:recombination protein NinG [Pseudoduganella flava]QGZ42702.1 ninG protein [Pseudoduganella flava]TWI41046.1 NinG protein [Pseudoduganella flava]